MHIDSLFLNWYAMTKELIDNPHFDEGEFPVDIINAAINAFEVVDAYELRPLLPHLTKAGEALLKEIEDSNAE